MARMTLTTLALLLAAGVAAADSANGGATVDLGMDDETDAGLDSGMKLKDEVDVDAHLDAKAQTDAPAGSDGADSESRGNAGAGNETNDP